MDGDARSDRDAERPWLDQLRPHGNTANKKGITSGPARGERTALGPQEAGEDPMTNADSGYRGRDRSVSWTGARAGSKTDPRDHHDGYGSRWCRWRGWADAGWVHGASFGQI